MKEAIERDLGGQLILGRYRVIQRLAQGGMGVVYLARLEGAAGFSKAVVVKRVIPDVENLEQNTAQFIREAQILSNLQHPGIVSVLDFGEESDAYAMVLEYVNGYDLGRWLKYLKVAGRNMHWEHAAYIGIRVLEALGYAHDFRRTDGAPAEVLHRDISPGNILLDVDGRVRLLDFGIARMAAADDGERHTRTGVLRGKAPYLAPELFTGARATRASDIYAFGIVLYQMLTGVHPFSAENDGQIMWRVVMEAPRPLAELRSDLPQELEACILRAIAKDPETRTASAARFASELRACLQHDEAEIAAGLRDLVNADFNGEMAAALRLEPLRERDRAWRGAEGVVIRESVPPRSLTPRTFSAAQALARRTPPVLDSSPASTTAVHGDVVTAPRARRRWKQSTLFAGGLGLVLVVSALNLIADFRPSAPAEGQRFIVVGTPGQPPTSPPSTAPAPPRPAAETRSAEPAVDVEIIGDVEIVTPAAKPRAPTRTDEAALLSRQFARQEATLQACFERHAESVQGQPQIIVHFDVAATGKVRTATLSPSSIATTPLGKCLLDVARRTQFGDRERPVRFSIPIQASKSAK